MTLPFFKNRFTLSSQHIQTELDQVTVKSEKTRAQLLLAFSAILLLIIGTIYTTYLSGFENQGNVKYAVRLAFTNIGLLFLYEGFIYFVFHRAEKKGSRVPEPIRYLNALVEVTFPSAGVFFASYQMDPPYALQSPAMFVYAVFIVFSTLRLNWKLSLWTGTMAALQYFSLSIYLLGITQNPDSFIPMLVNPAHYLLRSILILSTGFVAAFVSRMILSRIQEAIKQVDERNQIKEMFGQYVSPEVVNRLLDQQELNSEMRHVSILFFDIRNFTTFSESRSPVEVVTYLNSVFEIVVDIINKHNGIINKFLGDGFMAIFGAPLETGDDQGNALRAALEICSTLDQKSKSGELIALDFGIGIHSGEAVTGNVGSPYRKEYTIIGDSVNLASRIEQLNKTYGSRVLASEEVYQGAMESMENSPDGSPLPHPEFLGEATVKGKEKSVRIYRFA